MLCSRFKQILLTRTTINHNVQYRCYINTRFIRKRCGIEGFWTSLMRLKYEGHYMNSVRILFRGFVVNRFWVGWARSAYVGNIVRRLRRDRSVREVLLSFRQVLRPRPTLLISATAMGHAQDDSAKIPPCKKTIEDEELEYMLQDLDSVDELAKKTIFCMKCHHRLVIDKKQSGVNYCSCPKPSSPEGSSDGWVPYMEAEEVVIWRKEYKRGQGLYSYKVYGRYKDVKARDYAAVQVDNEYRRKWDQAVAALSTVEENANGIPDQSVLHWEVLWPRLFANRDYVYLRRHKAFDVGSAKSRYLFETDEEKAAERKKQSELKKLEQNERPSVHSNAKRKSIAAYSKNESLEKSKRNDKAFIICSKSCVHPNVPETKHAIRVSEYWSNMIIRTLDGVDKPGMEFVLTYYDEPAVGGLPSGVASWATGRAAPLYLDRMRKAAKEYPAYKKLHGTKTPEFTNCPADRTAIQNARVIVLPEEDMESSKLGPELEGFTKDQSTQTEDPSGPHVTNLINKEDKAVSTPCVTVKTLESRTSPSPEPEINMDQTNNMQDNQEEADSSAHGWWRYLHPFYYFV